MNAFKKIFLEMSEFFKEREEAIKAMILGLLSKQNVLLLGPPGTAKSAMVRALASHVGARYFEYLLTRFTTPEELFGFLSVKKAIETEEFVRNVDGYLPTAEIAFLDEIFKANSAILNSLLSIINERKYYNGRRVVNVPLITLYAASNELPEEDELSALYDRLLIRCVVEYLRDENNMKDVLLSEDEYSPRTKITVEDVKKAHAQVDRVTVNGVVDSLVEIRRELRAKGIVMSDRRYKQALKVVKANAFYEGRKTANKEDLKVLQYVLWDSPEQMEEVSKIILDVVDPFAKKLYEYRMILRELENEVANVTPDKLQEFMSKIKVLENDVNDVIKQLSAAGRDPADFYDVLNKISDLKLQMLDKIV